MLTDKLLEQEKRDRRLIEEFCRAYNVKLIRKSLTDLDTPGKFEMFYTFSDDFGPYTVAGIKEALKIADENPDCVPDFYPTKSLLQE